MGEVSHHGLAELTNTYLGAGRWEHHLHSPVPFLLVVLVVLVACRCAVVVRRRRSRWFVDRVTA